MNTADQFETIVCEHYEPLFRFAMSLTRVESDARDLTQQTFFVWATKGHQLRDISKVKGWLFTTLHREFLEVRRRQIRFPHHDLSELLAATNLAGDVASLRNQGVSVFTYPLTVQLSRLQQPLGAFQFAVTGPPGVYAVLGSPDLSVWSELGAVTNPLGSIVFTDVAAHLSPQKFYRARRQSPPTNMVFIPPNTFMMGSPVNELHRDINEGPQTLVTLSRGFWIGKYEVTQGEYLAVMNTNPSVFPGDVSRPVSSVSWQDATNY